MAGSVLFYPFIMRILSELLRHLKADKEKVKVFKQFSDWEKEQAKLPAYIMNQQTLLIIRLDDIGDYLLFQNFLDAYIESPDWRGWRKTLMGNAVWKPLFELWNADSVNDVIWVDKKKYLHDASYRFGIWEQLRKCGFEAVVCPSRTRRLLLDDMCVLASAAVKTYGSFNTLTHSSWNAASDKLYKNLFKAENDFCHEFEFNKQFANWCCGLSRNYPRPCVPIKKPEKRDSVVCFIGASAKSKRWTSKNWRGLICQLQKLYGCEVLIAGGKDEFRAASEISKATHAINIASKKSLVEMARIIAESRLIISNDTMAAHLAVCCQTPVVIIANGNNHFRFTDYESLGIEDASTVYPQRFLNWKHSDRSRRIPYGNSVSSDIAGITPAVVMIQVQRLLS